MKPSGGLHIDGQSAKVCAVLCVSGEELPIETLDYPGMRPGKKPQEMRLVADLLSSQPSLLQQAGNTFPPYHVSETRVQHLSPSHGKKRWLSYPERVAAISAAIKSSWTHRCVGVSLDTGES